MATSAGADAKGTSDKYAKDVSSLENLLAALYDVISGPAGKLRDWERLRYLCLSGARFIPCKPPPPPAATTAPASGAAPAAAAAAVPAVDPSVVKASVISAEDYIARVTPIFANMAFFERAVAHRIERFGSIAHVWSTYESFKVEPPPPPATPTVPPCDRGINSIQAMYDGTRWHLLTIMWQSESVPVPIPSLYLEHSDPLKPAAAKK